MQTNVNINLNLDGTKRIDEVFNLTVTLPKKIELNALEIGDNIEHKFNITSGILAKVSNSIILQMIRNPSSPAHPRMCLRVKLDPKPSEKVGIANDSVTLSFMDLKDGTTEILDPILKSSGHLYFTTRKGYLGYEFLPDPWPEQGCLANFSIPVFYRKLPAFKDEKTVKLKDKNLLGKLDPKDFFMSETFSDVVIECQGDTFPAHRIILAGSSPVFKAMLTLPTKEAEKGRIVIKDVDSDVFEGLLHFIYAGQIEPELLEEKGEELYCAADKYNVQDLLLICESHLLKNVKVENALVMYDLAQRHPESFLAKKSSEIIARNRDSIAADVDSFKNFTIKYPGLIFEIFKR